MCEPCPGGSSLECSDVGHYCFAGITGCNATNVVPTPVPSTSTELNLVQIAESTTQGGSAAPSRSPSGRGQTYGVLSAEPSVVINGGVATDNIVIHQNPVGNSYFCGEAWAKIAVECLASKPCPSGVGSDYCADHEGCFSVPSCTAQYESAANGGSLIPSTMSPKPSITPINTPSSLVRSCQRISSCSNDMFCCYYII